MGGIRKIILGAVLSLGAPMPLAATEDIVLVFAACTGRLSAQMEHAWLLGDTRADALQTQRQRFVSILDAIMPPDRAREVLNHRVAAKLAHSMILTTASFGTEPRASRLAKVHARQHVRSCETLLLDG